MRPSARAAGGTPCGARSALPHDPPLAAPGLAPGAAAAGISSDIAATGLAAAAAALAAPPADDCGRMALAGVRFLRGLKRALPTRWTHGVASDRTRVPVRRPPIPRNGRTARTCCPGRGRARGSAPRPRAPSGGRCAAMPSWSCRSCPDAAGRDCAARTDRADAAGGADHPCPRRAAARGRESCPDAGRVHLASGHARGLGQPSDRPPGDRHTPAFYALLKGSVALVGEDRGAVRALNPILHDAAGPGVWAIARRSVRRGRASSRRRRASCRRS